MARVRDEKGFNPKLYPAPDSVSSCWNDSLKPKIASYIRTKRSVRVHSVRSHAGVSHAGCLGGRWKFAYLMSSQMILTPQGVTL